MSVRIGKSGNKYRTSIIIGQTEYCNKSDYTTIQHRNKELEKMPNIISVQDVITIFHDFDMPICINDILNCKTLKDLIKFREQRVSEFFKLDEWNDDKYTLESETGFKITLIPTTISSSHVDEILNFVPKATIGIGIQRILKARKKQDIKKGKIVEYDYSMISYNKLIQLFKTYIELNYDRIIADRVAEKF